MRVTKHDGLLDGIEDDEVSEVPAALIGSVFLLEAAAFVAAVAMHCVLL
jgi:hypothetical protein